MSQAPAPPPPGHFKRLAPATVRTLAHVGRWMALVAIVLELLYVLAVNTVLNLQLIPKLISTDDIGMKWGYAYTLFPGFATVHGFYMRLQDPNIQFSLSIGEAHARFTLNDLTHRTFHITKVEGRHAVYLMRMRRTPEEVAQMDLSFLPLIEGFPAVPLRNPVEQPPGDDNSPDIWTVHIEGVHVVVDEGWFEQLRYRGGSVATGSFTLRPKQLVIVDGHWHVENGFFTLGPNHLVDDVHGDASVRIIPFDPRKAPGNEPLRYLDGLLTLQGRLSSTKFINPLFAHTAVPHLSSDEGLFDLFFHFDRALIAPGTHFRIRAPNWEISRGRYSAKATLATLDSTVDLVNGVPQSVTRFDLGPYTIRRTAAGDDPGGELITGDGMVFTLSTEQLDLLGPFFADLSYAIKLHEARMSDLRRLNAYLPDTGKFEVLGGTGTISADYVSPADDNGHGAVDIAAQNTVFRVQRLRLGGDLKFHFDLTGVASNSERFILAGERPVGAAGHAEGSFFVARPGDPFVASPDMGKGTLRADVILDPLSREQARKEGFLPYLSAHATVNGRFEGLDFINGLLSHASGLTISGGAGDLSVEGILDHGAVEPDSHADLHSKGVQVTWSEYQAKADAVFAAKVTKRTDLSSDAPQLAGSFKLQQPTVSVGSETLLTAEQISLSGLTLLTNLNQLSQLHPAITVRTTQARIPHLSVLDRYFADTRVRLEEGEADLDAQFTSPPNGSGTGRLGVKVKGLVASYDDLALHGALDLHASVGGVAQTPWKSGFWERTRLSSNGELHADLTLQPGPKSSEKGTLRVAVQASESLPAQAPKDNGEAPPLHDLLQSLVANATLNGEIRGVGYLNRFLGGTGVRAEGGDGDVNLSVGLADGAITSGSWGRVHATGLAFRYAAFTLGTQLGVTAVVGPEGPNHLSLGLGLDSYEVRAAHQHNDPHAPADPVLLQGTGLRLELRSDDLDPAQLPAIASLQAEMGDVLIPDLRTLNVFLPASSQHAITSGEARLTGILDKPAHGNGVAIVSVHGTKTGFDLAGHKLTGDWKIKAVGRTVSPGAPWGLPKSADVSGSGVSLSNVSFEESAEIPPDWWASIALSQGSLGLGEHPVVVGKLDVKARDVEPLFKLFGSELGVPGILSRYLTFDDLHGGANLLFQPGMVQVTEADLKSTRLRLRGRVLATSGQVRGELLLSDPPLNFGIDLHGNGTGFQLWGADGWYRKKLETPLAQKPTEP